MTRLDKLFFKLLKWYCSKRLDQWDRWVLKTDYGPVYVIITRESDGHKYTELKEDTQESEPS